MKLSTAARSRLAAEYALGTLRGPARRRFERMLETDAELAGQVREWRARWLHLYAELPATEPSRQTWHALEKRLGWSQRSRAASLWASVAAWRALAASALVALVVVTGWLTRPVEVPEPRTLVMVMTDDQARSGWVMAADRERITGRPVAPQAIETDADYELWLIPPGESPRSVGLIDPARQSVFEVGEELSRWLAAGTVMAISLEPPGGSPTGQPTGPIVYTGEIIEL